MDNKLIKKLRETDLFAGPDPKDLQQRSTVRAEMLRVEAIKDHIAVTPTGRRACSICSTVLPKGTKCAKFEYSNRYGGVSSTLICKTCMTEIVKGL